MNSTQNLNQLNIDPTKQMQSLRSFKNKLKKDMLDRLYS
jgi:hypothetical protein